MIRKAFILIFNFYALIAFSQTADVNTKGVSGGEAPKNNSEKGNQSLSEKEKRTFEQKERKEFRKNQKAIRAWRREKNKTKCAFDWRN